MGLIPAQQRIRTFHARIAYTLTTAGWQLLPVAPSLDEQVNSWLAESLVAMTGPLASPSVAILSAEEGTLHLLLSLAVTYVPAIEATP